MKWLIYAALALIVTSLDAIPVFAGNSLLLQPLQYEEKLQKGERKKGFIDITNSSHEATDVEFVVEGFRQVDDKGSLAFFTDEKLSQGVQLDYNEVLIPAGKTFRLFFVIDGSKLPSGDVFAAIFAKSVPRFERGATPSVRVGTILILENGTPSAREANVESFNASLLQVGESIRGEIKIKNIAPANTSNGFFPNVTVSMWPFGSTTTITGPLIYAGNTRTISFEQPGSQVGFYKVTARHGDSSKSQWMLVITGIWRWVLAGIIIAAVTVVFYIFFGKKRRHHKTKFNLFNRGK